ncbi:hypothetical protein M413DRAFT_441097 [Hebeloma cylindrosporum]|uniref:DUF952 domain-containing protein n=1 Tax=Hebeloma cylindrosporum TaxID=76867 RepID=A0A0C2YYG7_HEBCY|nr:hypothetical protein M413DRAFT_441097 [Hebeloma cylindrosporum h7]
MSTPTYIYKIVPASAVPPSPLPDALPVSQLDSSDGFIHLSTAGQVPGTLKQFFSDEDSVCILRIPYATVEKDVKWENDKGKGGVGEENVFPHLYNGLRLGNAEIETIAEWKWNHGWDAAINQAITDCWLIY